jgi:hypothetical protein
MPKNLSFRLHTSKQRMSANVPCVPDARSDSQRFALKEVSVGNTLLGDGFCGSFELTKVSHYKRLFHALLPQATLQINTKPSLSKQV